MTLQTYFIRYIIWCEMRWELLALSICQLYCVEYVYKHEVLTLELHSRLQKSTDGQHSLNTTRNRTWEWNDKSSWRWSPAKTRENEESTHAHYSRGVGVYCMTSLQICAWLAGKCDSSLAHLCTVSTIKEVKPNTVRHKLLLSSDLRYPGQPMENVSFLRVYNTGSSRSTKPVCMNLHTQGCQQDWMKCTLCRAGREGRDVLRKAQQRKFEWRQPNSGLTNPIEVSRC